MAKENPLDDFISPDADSGPDLDSAIDQQVDGLRDVLKKDAGELPIAGSEGADSMGGAAALDHDFGADFGADVPAAGGIDDPFGLNGDGLGMSDFGAKPESSLGAGALNEFTPAPKTGASGQESRMDIVLDIPVDVQIILGSSRMSVSHLMDLSEGATIGLDRKIGEPVDITVNGRLIGRGEITVLESDETRFGIKMIEVYGAPTKKG